MSANGISTLSTKQAKQLAKLDIAQAKRQGYDVAINGTISGSANVSQPFYRTLNEYDLTLLPSQYVGNVIVDNQNEGGLKLGRPWVTFLPKDLFAAGEKGVWFDPSDITSLFQDVAGTIPVTASGQTVALMKDKSGNLAHATQAIAAYRPTYYVYPGTGYGALQFDGTNDFMVTSAINFTSTAVMTASVGVQIDAGTTGARIVLELSADSPNTNGTFYITGPGSINDHSIGLRGTVLSTASFANVSGNDDILTAVLDTSQTTKELELIPRLNGTVKSGGAITWTNGPTAGTGNFGTHPLYIGARAGTSVFFKGKFYGIVVRGATSTAPQITATETWITGNLY